MKINLNDRFGDLTCIEIVKGKTKDNPRRASQYRMQCVYCGRTKLMLPSTILSEHGITHKACGKGLKTADMRFYNIWAGMRQRTTNEKASHANRYYERDISSEEFRYFIDFYDKMYASYIETIRKYPNSTISLERIDSDGNYSVENCTWIPIERQQSNTNRTVYFMAEHPDGTVSYERNVRRFAKIYGLSEGCIYERLNHKIKTKTYKGFVFKPISKEVYLKSKV